MNPFLDSSRELTFGKGGDLPHVELEGAIQNITFRLADSLPQAVARQLLRERESFEKRHPKPWSFVIQQQYNRIISRKCEELIDNGYGSCCLREPEINIIVQQAILHFDNERYTVYAYVIMPNHVHLLLQLHKGYKLKNILHSIKSYTANQINKKLGKSETLWMRESYDHVIRDDDDFKHAVNYIISNPKNLPKSTYSLYVSPLTPDL